jgi:hypothetical protein
VDSIAAYEPFHDGFIASRADLLALRGVRMAGRGKDEDLEHFKYMLETTVMKGEIFPELDRQTVEALKEVAGMLSWVDGLVLSAIPREDTFVSFRSI